MDRVIVACVQARLRLHTSLDEYREDLRRFLRIAQNKQANIVVFPELAGLMVAPPLLRDFRTRLLKTADRGRSKQASPWQRVLGVAAHYTATAVGADLRPNIRALLQLSAPQLWSTYANLFADLARESNLIIVAPSAYLPDPTDQVIRNISAVFGRDGALLGHQVKVTLHPEEEMFAQPGEGWQPIATEVGNLGLIVGADVLYPEVGRVLAYQGAEILLSLAACPNAVLFQKVRAGILARMQENQLFGLASFLVGDNHFRRGQTEPFTGKSAIFAPQELTPRLNGVLVEMANQRSEGVLTAEWDFVALKKLWDSSDAPMRQHLPLAQAGQLLARLYERLKALPKSLDPTQLLAVSTDDEATTPLPVDNSIPVQLDELPVVNSVTRRWLPVLEHYTLPAEELDPTQLPEHPPATPAGVGDSSTRLAPSSTTQATSADEETDEMDALSGQSGEKR